MYVCPVSFSESKNIFFSRESTWASYLVVQELNADANEENSDTCFFADHGCSGQCCQQQMDLETRQLCPLGRVDDVKQAAQTASVENTGH
jgi:hypothetical protein